MGVETFVVSEGGSHPGALILTFSPREKRPLLAKSNPPVNTQPKSKKTMNSPLPPSHRCAPSSSSPLWGEGWGEGSTKILTWPNEHD